MTRIDVDFNARDRAGHVLARVTPERLAKLAVGDRLYLYDPVDRLWARASVARIVSEHCIVSFDVDWRSFVEADTTAETAEPQISLVQGAPAVAVWTRKTSGRMKRRLRISWSHTG